MEAFAAALAFLVAAAGAPGQDSSSGSYGSSRANSRTSAAARVGGQPSNVPERGTSAQGRVRAGYEVGVASATAGGRNDTGPVVEDTWAHPPASQSPSVAQPTREEILQAQRRGRIRDRDVPDRIRGRLLSELKVPNPVQLEEVFKDPYRHRQDDLKP